MSGPTGLRELVLGSGGGGACGAGSATAVNQVANAVWSSTGASTSSGPPAAGAAGPGLAGLQRGPGGPASLADRMAGAQPLGRGVPGLAGPSMAENWQAEFRAQPSAGGMNADQLANEFHASVRMRGAGPGDTAPMGGGQFAPLGTLMGAFLRGDFAGAEKLANDLAASNALAPPSPMERKSIVNRSTILARQIFASTAPQPHEGQFSYADRQVEQLLRALRIHDTHSMAGPAHQFEQVWQGQRNPSSAAQWADQFSRAPPPALADQWQREFEARARTQDPASSWVREFAASEATPSQAAGEQAANAAEGELLSHTRALEQTMAASQDPKFRNSKFLNFVSKMNKREIKIVDDKLVHEGGEPSSSTGGQEEVWDKLWAENQQQQHSAPPGPEGWASEFEQMQTGSGVPQQWADEFEREVVHGGGNAWADEFAAGEYGAAARAAEGRHAYDFSQDNPFDTHDDPLALGKDLYEKGLLSEAALAFEAAVKQADIGSYSGVWHPGYVGEGEERELKKLKDPQLKEAWCLLGKVHAENDDDARAIAAMVQANLADPENLDILLDLGVSHTNELETNEAVGYLNQWVNRHPTYKDYFMPGPVGLEGCREMFNEIAAGNVGQQDVHVFTSLGVLYNLERDFEKAEDAFKRALELDPVSYSLWNKLGATQANSSKSKDAVSAYQRALDLKPNYVRAWSNMGIGFSNLGQYKEAIPYYVRALGMNNHADHIWGYLKIALTCSGHFELVDLVNERNIQALASAFRL